MNIIDHCDLYSLLISMLDECTKRAFYSTCKKLYKEPVNAIPSASTIMKYFSDKIILTTFNNGIVEIDEEIDIYSCYPYHDPRKFNIKYRNKHYVFMPGCDSSTVKELKRRNYSIYRPHQYR